MKELTLTQIQFDAFIAAIDEEYLEQKARTQIKQSKKYFEGYGNKSVTLKFTDDDFEECLGLLEVKSESDMVKLERFLLNAEELNIDIKTFCGGVEVVKKLRKIMASD